MILHYLGSKVGQVIMHLYEYDISSIKNHQGEIMYHHHPHYAPTMPPRKGKGKAVKSEAGGSVCVIKHLYQSKAKKRRDAYLRTC
jgi:hypothetical protein